MKRILSMVSAIAVSLVSVFMFTSCNLDENGNASGEKPEITSLELKSADIESAQIAVASENSDKLFYLLRKTGSVEKYGMARAIGGKESENAGPDVSDVIRDGIEIPLSEDGTAVIDLVNLDSGSDYVFLAVSSNDSGDFSSLESIAFSTEKEPEDPDSPSVSISEVSVDGKTISFTLVCENAVSASYIVQSADMSAPDAATVAEAGTECSAGSECVFAVEDFGRYAIYAVASGESGKLSDVAVHEIEVDELSSFKVTVNLKAFYPWILHWSVVPSDETLKYGVTNTFMTGFTDEEIVQQFNDVVEEYGETGWVYSGTVEDLFIPHPVENAEEWEVNIVYLDRDGKTTGRVDRYRFEMDKDPEIGFSFDYDEAEGILTVTPSSPDIPWYGALTYADATEDEVLNAIDAFVSQSLYAYGAHDVDMKEAMRYGQEYKYNVFVTYRGKLYSGVYPTGPLTYRNPAYDVTFETYLSYRYPVTYHTVVPSDKSVYYYYAIGTDPFDAEAMETAYEDELWSYIEANGTDGVLENFALRSGDVPNGLVIEPGKEYYACVTPVIFSYAFADAYSSNVFSFTADPLEMENTKSSEYLRIVDTRLYSAEFLNSSGILDKYPDMFGQYSPDIEYYLVPQYERSSGAVYVSSVAYGLSFDDIMSYSEFTVAVSNYQIMISNVAYSNLYYTVNDNLLSSEYSIVTFAADEYGAFGPMNVYDVSGLTVSEDLEWLEMRMGEMQDWMESVSSPSRASIGKNIGAGRSSVGGTGTVVSEVL